MSTPKEKDFINSNRSRRQAKEISAKHVVQPGGAARCGRPEAY